MNGGCGLPDVCAEDTRIEPFIERQKQHKIQKAQAQQNPYLVQAPKESWGKKLQRKDAPLLRAIVILILLMNIRYGRYLLYPFMIYSTWVHEMCHGMAAILVGGNISHLQIFPDGSGLAYTYTNGADWQRGIVASAGYLGTALIGGLMLVVRRTKFGPTVGLLTLGCALLLTTALYVRNTFGLIVLPIFGIVLLLLGWKLKAQWVRELYSFLSAACALNAFTSIQDLFASGSGYVDGELRGSDAQTVADTWGGIYWWWAASWMAFATGVTILALIFAIDYRPRNLDASRLTTTTTTTTLPNGNATSAPPPPYVTPSAPAEQDIIDADCVVVASNNNTGGYRNPPPYSASVYDRMA